MGKRHYFSIILAIFLLILSLSSLTGCGQKTPDSELPPGTKENETDPSDEGEEEDSDKDSPAAFSHAVPKEAPEDSADYVFPETAPFVDDTGRDMQRDGGCFYSYKAGNLIRFDARSGEVTLLYRTASTHLLNFCLHEDDIYFVERTGYDSLDGMDTSLWRIGKDGNDLTLLQDDIENADTYREWSGINYDIDIFGDIIYLLHNTSEYRNEKYVTKTDNLYYRLNRDGTVSEAAESETLYGALPRRFSPVFDSDFPSFPYAMRNYGYLFIKDSEGSLYRMDPVSGVRENLALDTEGDAGFCFSGDLVLLYSFYLERSASLFHLTDKTSTDIEIIPDQFNIDYRDVSPADQGFLFCCEVREKDSSDEETNQFKIIQIAKDGSTEDLTAASQSVFDEYLTSEEYDYYDMLFSENSCILNDALYCYGRDEANSFLTKLSLRENSTPEKLASYSRFPAASSPSAFQVEEQNSETEIGTQSRLSFSLKKALLEEQTGADREINRALSEIYADFEESIGGVIQDEKEQQEENPELYEDFGSVSGYDFSLSASCNYMDDDVISFCLDYYQYYPYAAHGYYWSDYYVFDRETGKQLTCEDFVGNPVLFQNTALPYVEQAAGWDFDEETLLEPSRFSLNEDGYTLYFAPYELDCYAAGSFLITIPYEAFEKNL